MKRLLRIAMIALPFVQRTELRSAGSRHSAPARGTTNPSAALETQADGTAYPVPPAVSSRGPRTANPWLAALG